jgi:hypothetical protein
MIAHGCREAAGTESGLQGNGTLFSLDARKNHKPKWENGMANYSLLTTDLTEKTLRQTSHFSNEWLKLENAFKNQRNQ